MDQELAPPPVRGLLNNRQRAQERWGPSEHWATPPSPEHYMHRYLWDSCFFASIYAYYGYTDEAKTEVRSILKGQQPDGLIPNVLYASDAQKFDLERYTFMESEVSSDYTQPPLVAQAVADTYKALQEKGEHQEAQDFLREVYPGVKKFYDYFSNNRQNSPDDPLIGNIHPHETGRDSDPTFDFFKLRLPRRGAKTSKLIDQINRGLDYASVLLLNTRLRSKKWQLSEAKKLFFVNDVMFNCVYADNLYQMSQLAEKLNKEDDAADFKQRAVAVEGQILDKMWFPNARDNRGLFFAMKDGQPIEVVSVSNLAPLTLPNLGEQQLESLLNLLVTSFSSKFPIPSVPRDSRNFDPHNQEKDRLWRGPTWINTNYLIWKGLLMQAQRVGLQHRPDLTMLCDQLADIIADASWELIKPGRFEHYDPQTGDGQRGNRVTDFGWSWLAYIMQRLK